MYRIIIAAGVLLALAINGFAQQGATDFDDLQLDHFKVYRVQPYTVFYRVELMGQFDGGPKKASLRSLDFFSTPVAKDRGVILDKQAHLTWYRLRQRESEPERTVVIENQFGRQKLQIGDPVFLLVPAEKKEGGSAFPKQLAHFKTYRVLSGVSPGRSVRLADQFDTQNSGVGRPVLFGVPVTKTHGDEVFKAENEAAHLTFYRIRRKGYTINRKVTDQFDTRSLAIYESRLLGVPTRKNPK